MKGGLSGMLYLSKSQPLTMKLCSIKRFFVGETHITRVYENSVLILMMGGILRFMEDGQLVELKHGEYYIQRAGLLQEGFQNGKPLLHDPYALPVYFYLEFQGGEFNADEGGIPIRGFFAESDLQPLAEACDSTFSDRWSKGNAFLLNAHMYQIFGKLWEESSNEKRVPNILSRVKRYIDSDYASITCIEDIARKFGYHKDHLNKIFKQKYHESLYRYLKQVRMKNARWLLENMSMPPTQVCLAVGYSNYSAFYRVFMDYYHISPKTMIAEVEKKTSDPGT